MNTILAVDDGITNANYNVADIMFLLGMIFAGLAGLAYASGVVGSTTVADPTNPPRPAVRFHAWAAALVAFAVGFIAFGLFLL